LFLLRRISECFNVFDGEEGSNPTLSATSTLPAGFRFKRQ
jgi:hypothetical protein